MSYSHKSFEYKFVFIREKHLIRISYTINTEFWLHNFWVQVWNLYSNVLRRWDLVWFPYHETGLHWNKEMTRHNLCLSKSKTFYVAFNDIPVNFWQSAAVLIVDETRLLGENHWAVESHWQNILHKAYLWYTSLWEGRFCNFEGNNELTA